MLLWFLSTCMSLNIIFIILIIFHQFRISGTGNTVQLAKCLWIKAWVHSPVLKKWVCLLGMWHIPKCNHYGDRGKRQKFTVILGYRCHSKLGRLHENPLLCFIYGLSVCIYDLPIIYLSIFYIICIEIISNHFIFYVLIYLMVLMKFGVWIHESPLVSFYPLYSFPFYEYANVHSFVVIIALVISSFLVQFELYSPWTTL